MCWLRFSQLELLSSSGAPVSSTSFSEQFAEFGRTYLHEAIKMPVPVLVSILPACSSSLLFPASLLM